MFRHFVPALVAAAALAGGAGAQQPRGADATELVRTWYRVHLGREPEAGAVARNAQAIRNNTVDPADVHATILGSDEYFERHGKRLPNMVIALYRELLEREPRRDEVEYWVRQHDDPFRGNRVAMTREFLRGVAVAKNPPPAPGRPPEAPVLLSGDPAASIRTLWRAYMGRVPEDLNAQVAALERGDLTLRKIQESLLASDEYLRAAGSNEDAYLTKVFKDVAGRDPSRQEREYWQGEFRRLRGDRPQFVYQFLRGMQRPVAQAHGDQLLRDTQQLRERVRGELGNTAQARQVLLRAGALQEAVERFNGTVGALVTNDRDLWAKLEDMERAHQATAAALGNPPGSAPESEQIGWRISRGLFGVRQALQPLADAPQAAPEATGYDRDRTLQRLEAAARDTQQLLGQVRYAAGRDPGYADARQDVEALNAQLEQLRGLVQVTAGREDVHNAYLRAEQQLREAERSLPRGRLSAATEQALYGVQADLAGLGRELKAGNAPPPRPAPEPGARDLQALVSQGLGEADAFLTSLQPRSTFPEVPAIHAEARTLRAELLRMRQAVAANEGRRELRDHARDVGNAYGRVRKQWDAFATNRPGFDARQLAALGDLVRKIERAVD